MLRLSITRRSGDQPCCGPSLRLKAGSSAPSGRVGARHAGEDGVGEGLASWASRGFSRKACLEGAARCIPGSGAGTAGITALPCRHIAGACCSTDRCDGEASSREGGDGARSCCGC